MTHTLSRIIRSLPYALSALAALLFLTFPRPIHAQSLSGFTYNGVVLLSYQANEYTNTSAAAAQAIRATSANYTAVLVTQYQQSATANVIAPETSSSAGYMSSYSLTPTDAAVVAAIQHLQAQGITPVLKPQVDSLDGIYRGNFVPSSPNDWFASYTSFLLHYAQLATQNNVGILVIGTELAKLSNSTYKANWETLIHQLRTLYPNLTLTYAANATGAGDEFTTVSFWADLDLIGVDGYFPLTNQADPTVAQLVAAWSNNKSNFNPLAALKNLQSAYGKPLIFTEIGYVSSPGTNEAPYANGTGPYDPTEQANCFEAFFQVFSQQTAWMKGVFWWGWSTTPPAANDTGYAEQNKPAGTTELPKWFGSTTSSFELAAFNPSLSLTQGATSATTLSVTPLGGFSGAVTFAASGLPTGVTASFGTNPTSGTSTLDLAASSAASTGVAAVTITGTSGALSASTTINVNVIAPQGFALLASVPALSVTQGSSNGETIAITGAGGFTSGVTLAASGLPAGVTANFNSNPATSSTMLTLTASATSAVGGPVTVTLSGTSGNNTASTSIALTVLAEPGFSLSGSPLAFTAGASSGNASTITVTPAGGFTGTVALTCAVNPAASSDPATCSFGPATVPLTGTASQVSQLTISTTAASTTNSRLGPLLWPDSGGATLAGLLMLAMPRRRRRTLHLALLAVLSLSLGLSGCANPNPTSTTIPGTPAGSYTVTITGTSGAFSTSTAIPLTVR